MSYRAIFVLAFVFAACGVVGCGSDSDTDDSDNENPPAACTFRMSGSLDFDWCEIYKGDFDSQTPAQFCSELAYNTGAFEDVTCESLGYTVSCSGGTKSKPGYTCP